MPVILKQGGTGPMVRLEGEVDISSAQTLKGLLDDALAEGTTLQLDLGAATALDVTIWQLLWAAERAAANAGTGFYLSGAIPEAVAAAMRDAGLKLFREV